MSYKYYKGFKWQVTFKLIKVIGNHTIRKAIYDFLFVFYCNYVYLALFLTYYHLFPKTKRRHVTVTTPTQGIVCNPSTEISYGDPVYNISSF